MSLALSVTQSALTCPEHQLVAAVRRGDDRAFEALYESYHRRIAAYVYGMVADHGRAEDITQEVFISVLRRLRETDRPIVFKPWLYEIAKNACIDEFRRARRGQEVPFERDDELIGGNPRLVGRVPTPETAVESKQKLAHLKGAFRGLSESHHKVIVLRELEGLSYAQIGEQLGMSQGAVESTLFRARRRLGEEYEDLISGRRCERVRTVIDEGEERTMRSLGIKERRLIARHLSHCQPCRRHAKLAGVEDSMFEQPRRAGKIAAWLPIPAWLRLRRGGASGLSATPHSAGLIQTAQGAIAANPVALGGFGRAAAAALTLVVAGAGTGIVSLGQPDGSASHAPHVVAGTAPAIVAPGRRAISLTPGRAGGRPRAVVPHVASVSVPAVAERSSSTTAPSRATPSGVSHSGGQRAERSTGLGDKQAAASGSSAPAHTPAPSREVPTVRMPPEMGLPNVSTAALSGIVKSTVAGISGSVKGGSLPLAGVAISGRPGTVANSPNLVRRTLEALEGATSALTG
jgi:RNA polymerase sigma factor (sigma-70 family)